MKNVAGIPRRRRIGAAQRGVVSITIVERDGERPLREPACREAARPPHPSGRTLNQRLTHRILASNAAASSSPGKSGSGRASTRWKIRIVSRDLGTRGREPSAGRSESSARRGSSCEHALRTAPSCARDDLVPAESFARIAARAPRSAATRAASRHCTRERAPSRDSTSARRPDEVTISRTPRTAAATTGVPHAIASSSTFGQPSALEASTSASAALYSVLRRSCGISSRIRTRSASLRALDAARSSRLPLRPGRPRSRRLDRPAARATTSMKRSWPFSGTRLPTETRHLRAAEVRGRAAPRLAVDRAKFLEVHTVAQDDDPLGLDAELRPWPRSSACETATTRLAERAAARISLPRRRRAARCD